MCPRAEGGAAAMTDPKPWAFELEAYIREGEPGQAKKSRDWSCAIGLQAVDGLTPSKYLLATAREHIEGGLTIEQVQKRIAAYYDRRNERTHGELENEEADVVSSRIAMILGLRLKKCALSIIHCLYRVGMWNSFQSMPDPYSSGAPSPRSRLPEADENSPSTWPSVGMTRRISAGASGASVCM